MVLGLVTTLRCRSGFVACLFMAAVTLAMPGCGGGSLARPTPVPVKGTVIFRGNPLPNARVSFFAKGAPMPAVGDTNEAGEFELSMYGKGDGALVGENKVTVISLSSGDGPTVPDPAKIASGEASPGLTAKVEGEKKGGVVLPKVYGDSSNTPLIVTVKPEGETGVKLELK